MKYERKFIVSNLYETSKSNENVALLSNAAKEYEVYDLDQMKDIFCKEYRHSEKIKSCDAYFYNQYNHLVVEFKNAHHLRLKEYYDEIEIKIIDTHMLLGETFLKNKKGTEAGKKVRLLVVYNDAMNYGTGVRKISDALNAMKPMTGDKTRNSKLPPIFHDDNEFRMVVDATKQRYEAEFFKEIFFIDKETFEEEYIKADYFQKLEEWHGMS